MRFMIVLSLMFALFPIPVQDAAAADIGETAGKFWRVVSGKDSREQKEVKALIELWLNTQNTQNFTAYDACYASRFQGVRRTGKITRRFDRAGWMKDRGRMFKKPMTVTIDKVEIVLTPPSAVVRFEQTWTSGKFKDVGPKMIVVVKEGGVWKISREELLQSTVLSDTQTASGKTTSGGGFFFVISGRGAQHVILDVSPVYDSSIANLGLEDGNVVKPFTENDHATMPEARQWLKKRFRFFEPDGAKCEGTINALELISLATPHFGTTQQWNSGSMTDAEVALEKWNLGSKVLAGHVTDHTCTALEVRWAQPSQFSGVSAKGGPADPVIAERALRAFRSLPSYAAIQKQFLQDTGSNGQWDIVAEGGKPEILVWQGASTIVSVFVSKGVICGGGFSGQLWALWRIGPDGKWNEITFKYPDHAFSLSPGFAVDIDGKGGLGWTASEGMSKTYFLRLDNNVLMPEKLMEIPYYDCPC